MSLVSKNIFGIKYVNMIESSINLVKMNICTYICDVYSVFIEIMKAEYAKNG